MDKVFKWLARVGWNRNEPAIKFAVLITSVILVGFHIYTTLVGVYPSMIQRPLHLALALVLGYLSLSISGKRNDGKVNILDVVFIVIVIASSFYIIAISNRVIENPFHRFSKLDLVFAVLLVIIIIDSTRKTVGYAFTILTLLALLYARYGEYIPGTWGHAGLSWEQIVLYLYHSPTGIYGMMLGISATFLAVFAIFGGTLLACGASQTFIDFANNITSGSRGGPAKVSIISSGLFGMVSGSAAANVVTTGTLTIPAMISAGYRKPFAAAVESVASTGGQLMPPIMGAGAFLMAEFSGIPYRSIAFAALIPALLYYLGLFFSVHFEAVRLGLPGQELKIVWSKEIPRLIVLAVPLMIFIILLVWGFSPSLSALIATIIMIILFSGFQMARGTFSSKAFCLTIAYLSKRAGEVVVSIATMLAAAQIVISLISLTGIGVKVSNFITSASSNSFLLALLLAAGATLLLGMGLPTTAAYALGAAVIAPSLVSVGLDLLPVHLFVFYFAVLASITPPVCGAVFLASGIADAPWIETAKSAIKLGLSGFIVPFMFMYSPRLLLGYETALFHDIMSVISALIGVCALSGGTIGYIFGPLTKLQRLLVLGGGFAMIIPDFYSTAVGSLTLLWYLFQSLFLRGSATNKSFN